MGIFDVFKKKEIKVVDEQKVDLVFSWLKKHYSKPAIYIEAKEDENLSIFDSKFGGTPYWNHAMEYPVNEKGNPLILLAQFNCSKEDLGYPYPDCGMLQFFIDCDDLYGLNFNDQTKQDSFKVIYHEIIDEKETLDPSIKTNGMLSEKEYFPFYKQFRLTFSKKLDVMNPMVENFNDILSLAIKELFNQDGKVFDFFTNEEYDKLAEILSGWNHKLLGYPAFTQWDPRSSVDEMNTVLFQMDSDCKDIIWGDTGICNFFINDKDLENKDFSNVLYNWDCY